MKDPGSVSEAHSHDWTNELRSIQAWIQAHPVLLATLGIFLPSAALFNYSIFGQAPLNLASTDVISSLPTLLAAIALLSICCSVLMVAPVLVLIEGAPRDEKGELVIFPLERKARKRAALQWIALLLMPAAVIAGTIIVSALSDAVSDWMYLPIICLTALLYGICGTFIRSADRGVVFSESTLRTTFAGVAQMLISVFVMQSILSALRDDSPSRILLIVICAMILLALLQVGCVMAIQLTSRYAGPARQAFLAAMGIVTFVCIFPPTGAWLAGAVLGSSATGGNSCARLFLSPDTSFAQLLLEAPTSERHTSDLRVLAKVDGIYLVRKYGAAEGSVYLIPELQVLALTPCTSTRKSGS